MFEGMRTLGTVGAGPVASGGSQWHYVIEVNRCTDTSYVQRCRQKWKRLPISFPLPSGQMDHRMISVTEATATILSLSPSEPPITLAFSATLSITQSRRGEVKTCCHPVDSFTLTERRVRKYRSVQVLIQVLFVGLTELNHFKMLYYI